MPDPNDDPDYPPYKITFKTQTPGAEAVVLATSKNINGPHTSVRLKFGGTSVEMAVSRSDADEGFPNLIFTVVGPLA